MELMMVMLAIGQFVLLVFLVATVYQLTAIVGRIARAYEMSLADRQGKNSNG